MSRARKEFATHLKAAAVAAGMPDTVKSMSEVFGRCYRQHWNHQPPKIPGAVSPAAHLPRYH